MGDTAPAACCHFTLEVEINTGKVWQPARPEIPLGFSTVHELRTTGEIPVGSPEKWRISRRRMHKGETAVLAEDMEDRQRWGVPLDELVIAVLNPTGNASRVDPNRIRRFIKKGFQAIRTCDLAYLPRVIAPPEQRHRKRLPHWGGRFLPLRHVPAFLSAALDPLSIRRARKGTVRFAGTRQRARLEKIMDELPHRFLRDSSSPVCEALASLSGASREELIDTLEEIAQDAKGMQ